MRVLLVAEPSMFHEGIEAILRQEPGLEIVGREADSREACRLVKESSPDVILIADGEAATELEAELLCLVREGFRMRIVEIHLETNTLSIYCGEQQPIGEARDLVDTLRHTCDSLTRNTDVPLPPAMGRSPA